MIETNQDPKKLAVVFGGSGFIGRHVVNALAQRGWRVRVACRRPDLAFFLQPMGCVGQIMPIQANVRYPDSVTAALKDADAVVNLVGVLAPEKRQGFEDVHAVGARIIAEQAAALGIEDFVHISAIGADAQSDSLYAKTKALGEAAVSRALPKAIIMRPSVVFGVDDAFFNRFAQLARSAFAIPLAGATCKMQPVFAGDVGEAVARALEGRAMKGAIYELGGPEKISLRDIVAYVCAQIERKRTILSLNSSCSGIMASATEFLSWASLGLYPASMTLTHDQIKMLSRDNLVSQEAVAQQRTLQGLGIIPEDFRVIAPQYLWRYRKAGQFDRGRNRQAIDRHPS